MFGPAQFLGLHHLGWGQMFLILFASLWLCFRLVVRLVCKAGWEIWNLCNERGNVTIQCLAREDPCTGVIFSSPWSGAGGRLGLAYDGSGGCRAAQKACKRRRTVVKGIPAVSRCSPNTCAKVARQLCKSRPKPMQKVAQQLYKARPKVTPRSPNSYAKVARKLWESRQTLIQRSSNSFANVAKQFCTGRPIVVEMSTTSCKGLPTSTAITYIQR